MDLYCKKQLKSTMVICKRHLVVIEQGLPKIVYFRLYNDKQRDGTYKPVKVREDVIHGLYKLYGDNKVTNNNLNDLVQNIKHTYHTLKKNNTQEDTLLTLTEYFSCKDDTTLHLKHGIIMEDDSIVFFYDYSDTMSGKLHTIFINGGLI